MKTKILPFLQNYVLAGKRLGSTAVVGALKSLSVGNTTSHLWYLYMLIGLYILTPIIRLFVRNATKRDLEYFIVVSVVLNGVLPLLFQFSSFARYKDLADKFLLSDVFGYTELFVSGYYLKKYDFTKKMTIVVYSLGVLSLVFTIVADSILSIQRNKAFVPFYLFLSLNIFLISIAVFTFFKQVVSKISLSEKVQKLLHTVAECSFGIYLVHMALILILNHFGITVLTFNPALSTLLISLAIMVATFGIVWAIRKIPFVGKRIT